MGERRLWGYSTATATATLKLWLWHGIKHSLLTCRDAPRCYITLPFTAIFCSSFLLYHQGNCSFAVLMKAFANSGSPSLSLSLWVCLWLLVLGVGLGLDLKDKAETRGVVLLDSITFPKIVPSSTASVVVLVCKKTQIGDYGTDSIRHDYFNFATLAQYKGEGDELLFAQVILNGAENSQMVHEWGGDLAYDHPQLFLFPKGSADPVLYPKTGEVSTEALTRFLSEHTSFYYGLQGTVKELDKLAFSFLSSAASTKQKLLEEAAAVLSTLEEESKERAEIYIKTMRKVIEKGSSFVKKEIDRLKKLIDSEKVSKATEKGLEMRLTILKNFLANNVPDL